MAELDAANHQTSDGTDAEENSNAALLLPRLNILDAFAASLATNLPASPRAYQPSKLNQSSFPILIYK